MINVELNVLCGNDLGHSVKRFMKLHNGLTPSEIEEEIRVELGKINAIYEYLRIQHCKNLIIATAFNGC